jgi:hypothetical protein
MKNYLCAFLIILLAGCEESEDYQYTVFELGQYTVSPAGAAFGIRTADGDTIDVTTLSWDDSRCPINVTCVRYGNYEAELQLSQAGDTAWINLCNGDCNSHVEIMDSARFSLQSANYWIRLRSLLPFPNTARPNARKNISFEIYPETD